MTTEHKYTGPSHDLLSRIRALHGEPLPEETVLKGMSELEYKLDEHFRTREVDITHQNKEFTKIISPLLTVIEKDEKALEGIRTLREIRGRRQNPQVSYPTSPKIEPHIKAGSVMTFLAPPYDYEWQAGSGGNVAGRNMGNGFASKQDGTYGTSAQSGINGGGAWGAAGVGIAFRPLPGTQFVRFYPFTKLNYYWSDDSEGMSAHNDAFLGMYVQTWDLNGEDYQELVNERSSLWSNGTAGWEPTRTDHGEGLNITDQFWFPVSSERQYVLWRWANSSCDGSEGTDFPFTIRSDAVNWTGCYTPFMVVEQF